MTSIPIKQILYNQYVQIIELKENHFADLKAIDKFSKITKTASAFANSDGGEIYVGIKEVTEKDRNNQNDKKRIWEGFKKPEDANALIKILDEMFDSSTLKCEYEFIFYATAHKGYVLHIEVPKTNIIISCLNKEKDTYLRRNAEDRKLNEKSLEQLKHDKGLSSYEKQIISDVEVDEISNSTVLLKFFEDNDMSSEPLNWLNKQRLINGKEPNQKPTVCGVILFSELPQAVLPKNCGIKIYRYKTTSQQGERENLAFDPLTIEGCAYSQIQDAVKKTKEIVEDIPKLGAEGLEKIVYPEETLHEIITNAVLHRDYSISDDIHVRIFDNRIEIESPGKLPGHINIKNILDERCSRNGNLVRIINKFKNPPNKDIGEGLNTAFRAMKKIGLAQPEICQKNNSVVVYIKHEKLASNEDIIIKYLTKFSAIRASTIKKICHFENEYQYQKTIRAMCNSGLIERTPDDKGKNSSYQLVKSN